MHNQSATLLQSLVTLLLLGVAATSSPSDVSLALDVTPLGAGVATLLKNAAGITSGGNLVPLWNTGSMATLASLASLVAIPAEYNNVPLNEVTFSWSSPQRVFYSLQVTSAQTSIISAPVVEGISDTGRVPANASLWRLRLPCVAGGPGGSASITIQLQVWNATNAGTQGMALETLSLTFRKECAAPQALPAFCGGAAAHAAGADGNLSPANARWWFPDRRTAPARFKIASYNIGIGNSSLLGLKATHAGSILRAMSPALDAVSVQEAWEHAERVSLVAALRGSGSGSGFTHIVDSAGQQSGLVFASRQPILACSFERFTNASGLDALAAKGVLAALTRLPNSSRLAYVFSSHLQAGGNADAVAAREAQLVQVRDFVLRTVAALPAQVRQATAVLLVGDLNTNGRYRSTYEALLRDLTATDALASVKGSAPFEAASDTWKPQQTMRMSSSCPAGTNVSFAADGAMQRFLTSNASITFLCPAAGAPVDTSRCPFLSKNRSIVDYVLALDVAGTQLPSAVDANASYVGGGSDGSSSSSSGFFSFQTVETASPGVRHTLRADSLSDHPLLWAEWRHHNGVVIPANIDDRAPSDDTAKSATSASRCSKGCIAGAAIGGLALCGLLVYVFVVLLPGQRRDHTVPVQGNVKGVATLVAAPAPRQVADESTTAVVVEKQT